MSLSETPITQRPTDSYYDILKEMSYYRRRDMGLDDDIVALEQFASREACRRGGITNQSTDGEVRCEIANEVFRFLEQWKGCDEHQRLNMVSAMKPRLILHRPLTAIAWSIAKILYVHRHLRSDSQAVFSLG